MKKKQSILASSLIIALTACGGGASTVVPSHGPATTMTTVHHNHVGMHVRVPASLHKAPRLHRMATTANVIADPGFESGAFSTWSQCGNAAATIDSSAPHSGTYDALVGNTAAPEETGMDGVCQSVTVPSSGTLTFWANEGTSETSTSTADQEVDVLDANGNVTATLLSENANTGGWTQKTIDMSAYAGQTVTLLIGIYGSGSSSDYNYIYVDDVSLTGSSTGPTPTPAPTTAPAYPCNNQQFLNDQSAFASGSITGDQFEQVCGTVTQVLPSKTTRSGLHGYFYVQMPDGSQIEIVSNLDAMAQAPTNDPPATWPWVAVGNYVYVQGRYYYDNSSSQGIDWTEDDTSSSWPHTGDVVVCDNSGNNCNFYW